MTTNNTRAESTRVNEARDYTHMPPNQMEIPDEIFAKFKEAGFSLRWVRILLGGEEDYKNIGIKQKEGYEFVTLDEIGGSIPMVRLFSTKNHKNLVTVGDVALAKIPQYKADGRRRYYDEKARELDSSARREIQRSGDQKMDKLTPLFDRSDTKVQVRSFKEDE